MDLIYMNASKEDLGVLLNYDFDLAFGSDENNFECRIHAKNHCCEAGFFLYIEDTEYGGMIDSVSHDTETSEVTYSGRTWHGILNSKVIEPDSGADYLVAEGDANAVIGTVLERLTLTELFTASSDSSGLDVSGYKFHRYITGYDGLRKMVESVGGKLQFSFQDGRVLVSAVQKYDFTQDEEFDSDQISFRVKKKFKSVNHLVCLGSGELAARMVVHLYADADGNISQTQTLFGVDEYAEVYDYPSVESEEELISGGTERLKELFSPSELSVALDHNGTIDVPIVTNANGTVTWDGNVSSAIEYRELLIGTTLFMQYAKVSNAVPTIAELEAGGYVVVVQEGAEVSSVEFPDSSVYVEDRGTWCVLAEHSDTLRIPYAYFVSETSTNESSVELTPGTWLVRIATMNVHASELTINGYSGYGTSDTEPITRNESYDIGDVVGAYDNITKISVVAEILKKIVTIKDGQVTISYEVGE